MSVAEEIKRLEEEKKSYEYQLSRTNLTEAEKQTYTSNLQSINARLQQLQQPSPEPSSAPDSTQTTTFTQTSSLFGPTVTTTNTPMFTTTETKEEVRVGAPPPLVKTQEAPLTVYKSSGLPYETVEKYGTDYVAVKDPSTGEKVFITPQSAKDYNKTSFLAPMPGVNYRFGETVNFETRTSFQTTPNQGFKDFLSKEQALQQQNLYDLEYQKFLTRTPSTDVLVEAGYGAQVKFAETLVDVRDSLKITDEERLYGTRISEVTIRSKDDPSRQKDVAIEAFFLSGLGYGAFNVPSLKERDYGMRVDTPGGLIIQGSDAFKTSAIAQLSYGEGEAYTNYVIGLSFQYGLQGGGLKAGQDFVKASSVPKARFDPGFITILPTTVIGGELAKDFVQVAGSAVKAAPAVGAVASAVGAGLNIGKFYDESPERINDRINKLDFGPEVPVVIIDKNEENRRVIRDVIKKPVSPFINLPTTKVGTGFVPSKLTVNVNENISGFGNDFVDSNVDTNINENVNVNENAFVNEFTNVNQVGFGFNYKLPIFPGFGFPDLPGGFGAGEGRVRKVVVKKRVSKYQPDLASIIVGRTGKKPVQKVFSGFEARPIVGKKVKVFKQRKVVNSVMVKKVKYTWGLKL